MTITGTVKPVRAPALAITSTDAIDQPRRSVLAWGPAKSGKTHFALSWPNPLVLMWDNNYATLNKFRSIPVIKLSGVFKDENDNEVHPIIYFDSRVIPAIQNRRLTELVRTMPGFENYTVETVVEDSLTSKGQAIKDYITQGAIREMGFEGWAQYLNKFVHHNKILTNACHSFIGGTKERECYNYVATVHEKYLTNKDGTVIDIVPLIDGAYQGMVLKDFDSSFSLIQETDTKITEAGKPNITTEKHILHTISPDRFRKIGDGLGGEKYHKLPAQLDNTYPALAKAWGLEENTTNS